MAQNTQTGCINDCDPHNPSTKIYIKKLCIDIKEAEALSKAKKTTYDSSKEDYKYKLCSYRTIQEVQEKYNSINNCISIPLTEDVAIIKKNVDFFEKETKNFTDTFFKGVQDAVKEIKKKSSDIDPCLLTDTIKDACNDEQRKKLCQIPKFGEMVDSIIKDSNHCKEGVESLFLDTSVIAGVKTFSNVDGMKEMGENLSKAIEVFKKNIELNIKTNAEELNTSQVELGKQIGEISKAKFDFYGQNLILEGLHDSISFVCDPNPKCKDINCVCNCWKTDDGNCPPPRT
jgi:hypothetical protein